MADDLRQYPPTSRRLRKLHEAGMFPYSRVLTTAVVFLSALAAVAFVGPLLLEALSKLLRAALIQARPTTALGKLDNSALIVAASAIAGLLLLIWGLAVLTAGLQRAGSGSPGSAPHLPSGKQALGLSRPQSLDLAWELTLSATILGGAGLIMAQMWGQIVSAPPDQSAELIVWLRQVGLGFGWRFAVLLAGLGLCDYLYQRAIFSRAASMTRRELEEDIRETEGPWLVRWRRRQRLRAR